MSKSVVCKDCQTKYAETIRQELKVEWDGSDKELLEREHEMAHDFPMIEIPYKDTEHPIDWETVDFNWVKYCCSCGKPL